MVAVCNDQDSNFFRSVLKGKWMFFSFCALRFIQRRAAAFTTAYFYLFVLYSGLLRFAFVKRYYSPAIASFSLCSPLSIRSQLFHFHFLSISCLLFFTFSSQLLLSLPITFERIKNTRAIAIEQGNFRVAFFGKKWSVSCHARGAPDFQGNWAIPALRV